MTASFDQHHVAPEDLAEALTALREQAPIVQCLTNIVVANFTANVLLAVGASPAMVDNPAEAGPFAQVAGGVLVNLGTPYPDTAEAMNGAVRGAEASGRPWVLDPVAAGVLRWRTALAHQLIGQHSPAIVRGNASEVIALVGGAGGKGVESVETAEDAVPVAAGLARKHDTVVAVSGRVDQVTDGNRLLRVSNGHSWLTQVTGAGCALGALMAGFAAVVEDRFVAASAATATLTVAADLAARQSTGPGTFAVSLLDQLASLTPDRLAASIRLS
jgi:hydroxyethylthiazole kinase